MGQNGRITGGRLNLYIFNVVRIAQYEDTCYAHLLTTDGCIE